MYHLVTPTIPRIADNSLPYYSKLSQPLLLFYFLLPTFWIYSLFWLKRYFWGFITKISVRMESSGLDDCSVSLQPARSWYKLLVSSAFIGIFTEDVDCYGNEMFRLFILQDTVDTRIWVPCISLLKDSSHQLVFNRLKYIEMPQNPYQNMGAFDLRTYGWILASAAPFLRHSRVNGLAC